ncbi:MAG: 50S ribosomal protein L23 [Patescibacteria group bacterium]|nr:50S ribosomal protein L23 [Patescibacteria group bacterium]
MGLFSRKQDKNKQPKINSQSVDISDEKKNSKKDKPGKPAVSQKSAAGKSMKELYGQKEVKTAVPATGKKEKKIRKYGNAYRVLIKPLITEKAANLGVENKYVFEVAKSVNKIEVAKAINEVYNIMPISVNILNVSGKKVRSGKLKGKRRNWKKAIVMLPKGKTINIYEGV